MQRLSESELDIMLALWEAENQPVPRTYFDRAMRHKNWSVNALNTFLSRLEDKGFLRSCREGKSKYYSSVVERDAYLSREGRSMLQRMYRGSLKNFLLSITDRDGLQDSEIDELQQYIDELREGRSDDE